MKKTYTRYLQLVMVYLLIHIHGVRKLLIVMEPAFVRLAPYLHLALGLWFDRKQNNAVK